MADQLFEKPRCCGHEMTEETFDFYSCRTCNGEAAYNCEEERWVYDCPWSEVA